VRPLRLLSGGAAQGLVEALRPSFEARTGWRIDGLFGAVGAMKARLLAGEAVDVMILSRVLIDELVRDGHLLADTARNIGTVRTAIAARAGDAFPDVGNEAELRTALIRSDEVHFPDPEQATAGIHFAKVMKTLGVWQEAAAKLRPAPNGATAMRALARSTSRRPLGCTQATEILSTAGVVLVAPLPPGCDLATTYAAAMTIRSTVPAEAFKLIGLLAENAAGRHGFD